MKSGVLKAEYDFLEWMDDQESFKYLQCNPNAIQLLCLKYIFTNTGIDVALNVNANVITGDALTLPLPHRRYHL